MVLVVFDFYIDITCIFVCPRPGYFRVPWHVLDFVGGLGDERDLFGLKPRSPRFPERGDLSGWSDVCAGRILRGSLGDGRR